MERKIMIVDDNDNIRLLMQEKLQNAGYRVYSVESGKEALKVLEHEPDIHVFLLDLKMPEMDGIELCKIIKNERPIDCLFALTGHTSIYDLSECREAGFEDYFDKTTVPDNILFKVFEDTFTKIERWRAKT